MADLEKHLFALSQQDDFSVLGLDRTADDQAVHKAYLALAQRYHPHRFARYRSPRASKAASEIFVRIQTAYGRLTASHKIPQAAGATPRTVRTRADVATSAATELLQYHQYDAVISQLSDVLADAPDHAEARIWLEIARARKHKAAGDQERALAAYRKVLEHSATHAEASAEVARLGVAPEKSLFARLFKRGG